MQELKEKLGNGSPIKRIAALENAASKLIDEIGSLSSKLDVLATLAKEKPAKADLPKNPPKQKKEDVEK